MSKQITLRNVSPELARRLKEMAAASGTSLNRFVLELLERAVGANDKKHRLMARYATWTDEDGQEFEEALRAQRVVDESLWS